MKIPSKLLNMENLRRMNKVYDIMKFGIEKSGPEKSRIGKLELNVNPTVKLEFETPMCFFYTEAGNIPHLTYDVLQKLTSDKVPMQLPFSNILNFEDSVASFSKGIADFVGLPEYPIYIPVQDPAKETKTGYNVKKSVSVWNNGGRNPITLERFMKIQESFCPHMYQSLCDSDTPKDCSNKRINHSVTRSLEMLDACLKLHSESNILKNSAIFGSIQGGFSKDSRKFSAIQTALRPVDGFVIEGFHNNGRNVESMKFDEVKELLNDVLSYLPPDKPRLMHGSHNPEFIINSILSGVDIFDSSYPYSVTARGCASVFKLEVKNKLLLSELIEINLEEEKYKEDLSPILENCNCYACGNFSKAYINHLLITMEMLGSILLMLHNLHHFGEFFKNIRMCLKNQ